jgi:nitronate monooxygenase
LDKDHNCSYKTARELYKENGTESEKVCLCSMMFNYKIWTCGHTVSRLKETTNKLPNGSYQTLTTEQVFNDYINSTDQRIQLPPMSESIVIG